jgi:hypothetical protein
VDGYALPYGIGFYTQHNIGGKTFWVTLYPVARYANVFLLYVVVRLDVGETDNTHKTTVYTLLFLHDELCGSSWYSSLFLKTAKCSLGKI